MVNPPDPVENPPPCSQTITGRLCSLLTLGVHTFKQRQTSRYGLAARRRILDRNPPPCSQTITGRLCSLLTLGVHTFKQRQSSPIGSVPSTAATSGIRPEGF